VKLGFKINTPLRQLGEIHTVQHYCVWLLTESIHNFFLKSRQNTQKSGSGEQILALVQILVFTCPQFLLPSLGKIKLNKKHSQILVTQRCKWFKPKPAHLAEGEGGQVPAAGPAQSGVPTTTAGADMGTGPAPHAPALGTLTLEGPCVPTCTRRNRSVQSWTQFFARICTKTTCNCK